MKRFDGNCWDEDQIQTFDVIVIGSGFGGSVSAMRLAEKGYKVLVIEKGRRWKDEDFPRSNWQFKKYFWMPRLKWFGIQKIDFFRQLFVISGTGVGGGSLVYANTHMMPPDAFYTHPAWGRFKDWKSTLKPFYERAKFMLGTSNYKKLHPEDLALRKIAEEMGQSEKFTFVDGVGVYLSESPDEKDPYFNGLGPVRKPCVECAGCMVGCRHNAKNTLEKNYLFFAEKFGARIMAETEVDRIEPRDGGYRVGIHSADPWRRSGLTYYTAKEIVIAGGVLGTLKLLFRQREKYRTLPDISARLGENIRSNSEMLAGVTATRERVNNGIAISTIFHPDEFTHVELCKYPDGSGLMNFLGGPAVDNGSPLHRSLIMLGRWLANPFRSLRIMWQQNRARNTIFLLVMQHIDSRMKMQWKRSWTGLSRMRFKNQGNNAVPSFIPQGQEINRKLAEKLGGEPLNALPEVVFGTPTTAHILGGCPMGETSESGVVNEYFELHGYPGIRVIDGSIIPANLGVNPSLTITALAEYAMDQIPVKPGFQGKSLEEQMTNLKRE